MDHAIQWILNIKSSSIKFGLFHTFPVDKAVLYIFIML